MNEYSLFNLITLDFFLRAKQISQYILKWECVKHCKQLKYYHKRHLTRQKHLT